MYKCVIIYCLLLCALLYSVVAFFADLITAAGGLYLWHGSDFANFIVKILESVPSSFKLRLNLALFFVTILNTFSSSALECGRVTNRSATVASLLKIKAPSGDFNAFKYAHIVSI